MSSPYPPRGPRVTDLDRLRWRGVWLPSTIGGILLAFEWFSKDYPRIPWEIDLTVHVLLVAALTVGAYYFSSSIFDVVRQGREELIREHEKIAILERRFRALIENSSDGIMLLTADRTIAYASPAITRILGYTAEELTGREALALIHPDDREQATSLFAKSLQEPGVVVAGDARLQHKDGTMRWIGGSVCNLLAEPSVEAIVCNYRDITVRKQAEEALQRANQQLEERVAERTAELRAKSRFLEAFFNHSLDSLAFLDRHFNYIRVNETYARACQRDAAEFPGHNHFEFYPHAENQAIFENVVRTKKPFMVQAKPFTFPDHPEWGVTYWDWSLVPVLDANEEVDFLVFSLSDVTQRERAEQEVRAASRHARSLIEASLDPLVTINPAGQITDVNAATELATGFSRKELIGTDLSDYFTEPEKARAGYQHAFHEGAVRNYPLGLRHQDGRITPVLYNASVYRGEVGEVIGVFAAARDVTELRRAEEAIHESRALLAGIIGSALDAIITTDADGNIIYFNAAAEQIFRCPAMEAVGAPVERFIPERFRPAHQEGMRAFGQTTLGKRALGTHGSIIALRTDGEEFPAEAAISQVEVGGQKFFTVILRDVTLREQAEAELRSSREQLRALAAHVESVREEERTRIAREIHDELGQQLTGLKIDLGWLAKRLPAVPGALSEKARNMGTLVDATIQSVRRLVTELRPGVLDDLGLVAAIEWQAQEFETRTGIACQFTTRLAEADLDSAHSTALFRILQEALTNITRHAQATRVGIHLEQTPERLVLTVADNGRGITQGELANRQTFGLLGMRERARSIGGRLTILGQPEDGTTVTVEVPPRSLGAAAP